MTPAPDPTHPLVAAMHGHLAHEQVGLVELLPEEWRAGFRVADDAGDQDAE